MKSLFFVESHRLFKSRAFWLTAALIIGVFLSGFLSVGTSTMYSIYLAHQIKNAAFSGGLFFAAFTLFELSRVRRSHMDNLINTVIPPLKMAVIRLAAIFCAAFFTVTLLAVLYTPYLAYKLANVFSLSDALAGFYILLFPALCLTSLAAALCYNITQRADISLLSVLTFLLFSNTGTRKIQFLWKFPNLPALSNDFGNTLVFRTSLYVYVVWFLLLGGIWILSLLCIRKYQKNIFASFACNIKKAYLPFLSILMLAAGALAWQNQPFFDHSPIDWMDAEEENYMQDGLSLTSTDINVQILSTFWGTMSGKAVYSIENSAGKETDFYFALNSGYQVKKLCANGEEIPFTDLKQDYIARRYITCTLPAQQKIQLEINYGGMPKLWNVMQDTLNGSVISPQYIDLSGSHLAPKPEIEMASKDTPIQLTLTLPAGLTPVTSGYPATLLKDTGDGFSVWSAKDTGELSMTVIAGDFVKAELDGGGMPVEFYYSKKHQSQLDSLNAVQTMEDAIRYCTQQYGPRAFTADKPFKIIQCTVFLFGGFAKYNISAISEGSFTIENMADIEKGSNGAEVLAHEIIHQWWGLGQMVQDDKDPYWTSEALTVYTTYRLMEHLKGTEYAETYYLNVWKKNVEENKKNFYIRHPEYLEILPEEYAADLKSETQGVNLYSGYPLMIARAAEKIGGNENMDKALSKLFLEGGTEMPPYISLQDFLNACGLTKEAFTLD